MLIVYVFVKRISKISNNFEKWLCNEFFTLLTEFSTKQRAVRRKKGENYTEFVENSSLKHSFQLNLTAFQQNLQLKVWNISKAFQRNV